MLIQCIIITVLGTCVGNAQVLPNNTIGVNQNDLFSIPPVGILDKQIRSIYQDKSGVYWFGSNANGVYRYDSKTLTQFTVKNGLPDNQINSIQEDSLGNLWFGTGQFGVSKYDGTVFTTYTFKNNILFTKGAHADWVSSTNALWFYSGDGVFRYDNQILTHLPFGSKENKPFELSRYGVYCILKDSKGNIWIGTQSQGVARYDGKELTWFTEKGLAGPAVLSIFEDSKGIIWFGNNGAGLFTYDGAALRNFTEEHKRGNQDFTASGKPRLGTVARVYTINEDNLGNLCVGTVDSGVWKYDGENLINYTTKDGLTSNAVNTIYKDKKGDLWFGTDNDGICKFNGTKFVEYVVRLNK